MSSVHTIAIPVHSNSTSLGTGPSLNAFRKISQHEFLCGVVHNIYGEWLNILSFLYNYSNYLQIWKDASVCVAVLHILPDIAQGWDISVELNPSHPGSLLLDPDKIMLVEVQHHASSVM